MNMKIIGKSKCKMIVIVAAIIVFLIVSYIVIHELFNYPTDILYIGASFQIPEKNVNRDVHSRKVTFFDETFEISAGGIISLNDDEKDPSRNHETVFRPSLKLILSKDSRYEFFPYELNRSENNSFRIYKRDSLIKEIKYEEKRNYITGDHYMVEVPLDLIAEDKCNFDTSLSFKLPKLGEDTRIYIKTTFFDTESSEEYNPAFISFGIPHNKYNFEYLSSEPEMSLEFHRGAEIFIARVEYKKDMEYEIHIRKIDRMNYPVVLAIGILIFSVLLSFCQSHSNREEHEKILNEIRELNALQKHPQQSDVEDHHSLGYLFE